MESKNNNNNGDQNGSITLSSPPLGSTTSVAARPPENRTTQGAAASAASESRNNDIISMALSAIQMMPSLNNQGLDLSGNNMASGNMFQQLQQIGLAAMQQAENARKNAPGATPAQASSQQINSATASVMQQQESAIVHNPATTQHSLDTSKTSNKRSKRTVVVPCRARGMSVEHNFQTAYFEIPHNMKHGDGLICSFPACRNRGVKFLYCSFCQDPVAKRNFRNRHSHGQAVGNDPDENGEREVSDRKMNNHEKSNVRLPPVATVLSSSLGSSTDKKQEAGIKRKASCVVTSADDMTKGKTAKLDPRKEAWDYLLRNRPLNEDSDGMSSWLMQVMAVSDPTNLGGVNSVMRQIPIKESLGANTGSTSTSTEMDGTVNFSTSSITNSRNGTTDSSSAFISGTRNGTTDSSSSPTDGSSNDGESNEEPSSSSNGSPQSNSSNDSSSSDNQENTGDSSSN